MKIKIINPNTTHTVTEAMARIAADIVSPGTAIVAASPQFGPPAIEGFYDEAFAAIGVLDEVRNGDAEGCDGYVIACFGDPGLAAARELTTRPVVGIAEAAMQIAGFLGASFTIISMVERVRPMLDRVVAANAMGERCRSIRMVGIPLLDFDGEGCRALIETCRAAVVEDRAECIVLGSGGLAAYADMIGREVGVPVIDGVAAAVKTVETLVTLGLATSKRQSYAFPPSKTYTGSFEGFSPRPPAAGPVGARP